MAGSDARTLAHRLAGLDDAALAALLSTRHVSPAVSWDDAFDAAEHLLEGPSLGRALTDLTAAELDALDEALASAPAGAVPPGYARDLLDARALLDDGGAPWEPVAAALRATPRIAITPDAAEAATPDDAREAERAFAATGSLADVLQAALAAPLARIGAGALGAVDRRRLVETGAVDEAAAADELVEIGARAGLLAPVDRAWLVTPQGVAWLHTGTLDRWVEVARRLRSTLPDAVRTAAGGWIPLAQWPAAHPLDAAWPDRAAAHAALLRRWGLVSAGGAPATWAAPLADGADADGAALAALLPPEVDRVYLQNDLTAIAPGSLAPELDMRLRSMARRESRAQASSYRFTAETLADALTAGETADTLREFLQTLSLTGLPQPLAYEIERSASRHGALRVGPDPQGRTRVTSTDEGLLRTLAVDQALRPLGLVPDGDALVTRSSPDTTFWLIADARYPVIAVDADGARRALDRHRLADGQGAARSATEVYGPLIARLRAGHNDDAEAAWLGRELEQAVRARATILVAVHLPDGTEREFTIEATGLGGGRLRGRDRVVDVERTLPVASITRVRAVDAG